VGLEATASDESEYDLCSWFGKLIVAAPRDRWVMRWLRLSSLPSTVLCRTGSLSSMGNLGQIVALKGEADLTVSTMAIERFGEDRWRAGVSQGEGCMDSVHEEGLAIPPSFSLYLSSISDSKEKKQ
jgi:hypothetical protein